MKKLVWIATIFMVMFFIQFVSSAHYITGYVSDALDGEGANGKIITLWNPANGQSDNVTDIVGAGGASGYSNVFLIDCELLDSACQVNDILSVKIFDGLYISQVVNITTTVAGYDVTGNITLNSPPVPGLIYPLDGDNVSASINFNCSYFDFDDDIDSVEFWGNWSGGWQQQDFQSVGPTSGYANYSNTLSQGEYIWNCLVRDALGIEIFSSSNNTFFVDTTNPVIDSVTVQDIEICGFGNIEVNCSAYDVDTSIHTVLIESILEGSPNANYTTSYLTGNIYRAYPNVNQVGNWSFRCYANDSVGNSNSLLGATEVSVYSGSPEIFIVNEEVFFDKSPSVESELINVSVVIENSGCGTASNFIVGFSNGVFPTGDNFDNETVSIPVFSNLTVSTLFPAEIGFSNIFVYADLDDSLTEDNESNNEANGTLYLKAWQRVYGNLSLDKTLSGQNSSVNISFWGNQTISAGSIFIADTESNVDWLNLQSIGRNKSGGVSSNDFSEIDTILGMASLNDSIYDTYTNSGAPKDVDNITIFKNSVENVPIVNTSTNGNFATGILWDMSDSVDSEYDSTEAEDVIFVAKVNNGATGDFGIYDYEINIPAKLRDYESVDTSDIYLYYDLN